MLASDLVKLYNTLGMIETKGENTKIMAQCLVFTEQLVNQAQELETKMQSKPETESNKKEK